MIRDEVHFAQLAIFLMTNKKSLMTVKNLTKAGRPNSATNDNKALNVCLSLEENKHLTSRKISIVENMLQALLRIPKETNFSCTKETSEDDSNRMKFSERMMEI